MDSLTITIIFIVLSTVIGAFVKGRMRDRCLLDFVGNSVNIELKDGKVIWGFLQLEATGLELKYKEPYLDKKDNHIETSFVLYKNEYSNIQCIVRYFDDLDEKNRKKRSRSLNLVNNQKGLMRIKKKVRNFFATVKDSIVEVVNLLMGRMGQIAPIGRVVSGQDKYVSQMQQGILSSLNTSYEPLLEKHLGKKVILKLSKAGNMLEYSGVLKGYSAEFLEIMDVAYSYSEQQKPRKADIVIPRSVGAVRHLGE